MKSWQALLAVVGLIVVMIFAWRMVSPVPKFTSAEQAQFDFATADLEAFLPSVADLALLPWAFYDCTEENLGVVGYDYNIDYDPDGGGGDLTGSMSRRTRTARTTLSARSATRRRMVVPCRLSSLCRTTR